MLANYSVYCVTSYMINCSPIFTYGYRRHRCCIQVSFLRTVPIHGCERVSGVKGASTPTAMCACIKVKDSNFSTTLIKKRRLSNCEVVEPLVKKCSQTANIVRVNKRGCICSSLF
jgi:hypothetical protein